MDVNKASLKRMDHLIQLLHDIYAERDPQSQKLQAFLEQYSEIPREEKPLFFNELVRRLEVKKEEIEGDLRNLMEREDGDAVHWSQELNRLRKKLESPRVKALRGFLNLSGGLKFLLDLRADVIAAQRQASLNVEPLDKDIAHLFNSWFQGGFLYLQEITQDSSFRQIQFLKSHDMVHPMTSLEEMGYRLGEDRRCFALYHRVMPEEPVVFIEVALSKGIIKSIHDVIDKSMEEKENSKGHPDTAIFYSINNTQNGLAGLGLGKVLIFQVVDALKNDHPGIRTFSTLSPIPGFWERYLRRIIQGDDAGFNLKQKRLLAYFPDKVQQILTKRYEENTGHPATDFPACLLSILSEPSWTEDPIYTRYLKKPLTEIGYYYVTQEKNRQGKPLNPVANFHMGNGATVGLSNINFGGNLSPRGVRESCSLMVNYVYSRNWLQELSKTMQSWLPWT